MEYILEKPISELLADYLKRYTHETDIYPLLEKHKKSDKAAIGRQYSHSTINQLRIGRIAVTENTKKYIDDLFAIAVKNQREEREKFRVFEDSQLDKSA